MRLLFKSDYVQDESPEAVYLRVIDLYFFFYSLPYRVLASPYQFHYSYISLMTSYIVLVSHSSGESVLNTNCKNK